MRVWYDNPAAGELEEYSLEITPCRQSALLEGVQNDRFPRSHQVEEERRGILLNTTHPGVVALLADNAHPLLEGRGLPAFDLGGTARLAVELRGLQFGEGIADSLRQKVLIGKLPVRRTAKNARTHRMNRTAPSERS